MAVRAIQVSIDGAKQRREIDDEIINAYDGQADTMLNEIEDLLGVQA